MALTHWEVAVDYSHGGVDCVLTHHFQRDDASGETAAGVANAWRNAAGIPFRAILPPEWTTTAVRARQIAAHGTPQPATYILPWAAVGTRSHSSELLAEWLACRATLYTAFAGRQNRGANIFAGGAEEDTYGPDLVQGGGFWYTAVDTYLGVMNAAFGASGTALPLRWCVFSRKRWELGAAETDWSLPVTGWIVRTTLRGKRTRRP